MGKYTPHPLDSDLYKPYIQDKPYPFGKYEKATYELWVYSRLIYSFVTTIRSEEECVDVLLDKYLEFVFEGKPKLKVFKNGIRKIIST
jgi:hypothetical protein